MLHMSLVRCQVRFGVREKNDLVHTMSVFHVSQEPKHNHFVILVSTLSLLDVLLIIVWHIPAS